jgi:transcriptional regulator with XRE-family HTH domain
MLDYGAKNGEPLSQTRLAEESGVSLPTVQRWYAGGFDRIDANTVHRLTAYFGCTLAELIEVTED